MPRVLTTNAIVRCPHGGVGLSTPNHPLWSVDGGAVLVAGDPGVILGCLFLSYPCVSYTLRSMGLNATRVEGLPVILVTDINLTNSGLPLSMTEVHTTFDDSTPAPLPPAPPGAPAPPPDEALADFSAPEIMVAPAALAVVAATPPPQVEATFRLAAAHPLRWSLTLIDEPEAGHRDVSAGEPGLELDPAGGAWPAPVCEVRLTLKESFLRTLLPGLHHFYMTGVSRRGLSAWRDLTLLVT